MGGRIQAWQAPERPSDPDARRFQVRTFNGLAQILLQSTAEEGIVELKVEGACGAAVLNVATKSRCN